MARLLALLLSLWLLAPLAAAKPNKGPFKRIAVITLREKSEDALDPSVKVSVLRRLEEAKSWGADCVVLDIESYGGYVSASMETGDEIYDLGRGIHTVAFVHRKAISGAAMLSMSCQEIVMSEVAKIGDSQVIYINAKGEVTEGLEKQQTTVAAAFRTYADGNGYPVALAEAMVRKEMEVLRYKVGGEWRYFAAEDVPDDLAGRDDGEIVVKSGQLATFSAKEAVEHGIASRLAPDLEALLKSIRAPDAVVRTFDWTWSEKTSRFLLGIRGLLFMFGIGALYLAFKTPGTGAPELIAIICFGLFFGASAVAGFAGVIELVLFFAGLLLIGVEIFLLPGMGVAGLAGLVCVLLSIGLAALPAGDLPAAPSTYLLPMARDFFLGAIAAAILVAMLVRHLPKLPYFNRLVLETALPAETSAPAAKESGLVGERGVAETPLHPAGAARIGGKRVDVVTEGAYVDPQTPVRVVAVQGNRVVVRPEKTNE
jgi:membrane-bound serine protease (ClpP class)